LVRSYSPVPPKQDLRGFRTIGTIIHRFNVIAGQEAKGNLRALRDLIRWLAPDWAFLMTDITLGAAGNSERKAFLYDRRRVWGPRVSPACSTVADSHTTHARPTRPGAQGLWSHMLAP
jgi:hypothetical protein